MIEWIILIFVALFFSPMFLFINKEWEKSIIFRLGKFSRMTSSGLNFKIPFIENYVKVDVRLMTMDIQKQEVITKDNISVYVDAVVFYKVINVKKAIIDVGNYLRNVEQQSLGSLRDVVGEKELDELLSQKEAIAKSIKDSVDQKVDAWGIDIDQVKLQNIELPADLKRVMARQAEAEREKRAVIISAQGELEASKKLKLAADELAKTQGAMQLRVLSTISDVSQDQSNTLVFALPWEMMQGKGAEYTAAALSKGAMTFSYGKKREE
ncbi:MAG: slipin family protein [Candidatus Nanoarchaeia archaeon]|jgi:regulator of protease activity HflC (stomatin/prohibitin superfamily)